MTTNSTGYLALLTQLQELDAQIKVALESEREAAIVQIKALMSDLGISIQDLQEKPSKRKAARLSSAPLYRDPKTGKTWAGRGRQPAWLGEDPAQFLIQPDLLDDK
ncbi:H-NS histone family protein [Burkholderia gladioli]|uniref:H-NS histone family protein n=1 Tax=Burkholderia gladioli TaxID=28095 RepID=UPI00285E36A3|nr:H-NS histone family protein [Burkholderia gladioli]MDR8093294.1 H-NS histone family protein [Burkholderia gladioli]